ncbi:MAG: cardiolipin synthase [Cellulosilyticaceae bacterium]
MNAQAKKEGFFIGRILNVLLSRMAVVGVLLLIQMLFLGMLIWQLSQYFVYIYAGFVFLSMAMVFWVMNKRDNPEVKIPWIIMMMAFPIFGGLFYLMFGTSKIAPKTKHIVEELAEKTKAYVPEMKQTLEELTEREESVASQSQYIYNVTGMGVYKDTTCQYLGLGEELFEAMKKALNEAEHYIFMEYFILEEGEMWGDLLEILERKVKEGVDVRVMYDDVGCLQTLPRGYHKKLEEKGIKCVVFNPFRARLAIELHNRDHRKITVIDGYVGFTGGVNLADEYINAYPKHGHWKDCGLYMKGEAVWGLTLLFLELWNYYRPMEATYEQYMPHVHHPEPFESDGYVQPFGDSPFDEEYVGESVYLNMINQATKYIYINSPYLIVDNEMITAFNLAAKRGVDVRIVTPHIGDKWYVHMMTRSYYQQLIQSGVKIYEYTPGFIHSKTFVADDKVAVIGTINLDYRSLYHHYECGAFLAYNQAVMQLKEDFEKTLEVCTLQTIEDTKKVPLRLRVARGLLRLMAPLM